MRWPIIKACCILLLGTFSVVFWQAPSSSAPAETSPASGDKLDNLRVSGPVVHDNLAVYFLHSRHRDDRNFLTLNEGLKQKLVKVTELENEQVNSLVIENLSDHPLFLQEGDRVTGGKQDRTIYSSLVIAPRSGELQVPTFCVEPSRWQEGATGRKFVGNFNPSYAANNVRNASKLLKNQSVVWENVAQAKGQLQRVVGTKDKTSSLNEAQDSERVTQSTKPFLDALGEAANSHDDLVGIAFAVNGQVQEVNIYPGREITKKIYPRLLETFALDAIVQANDKQADAPPQAPDKSEILATLKTATEKKPARSEKINGDNGLQIFAADAADAKDKTRLYRCETKYQGRAVHLQWLKGPESVDVVRQAGNQPQRPRGLNYRDAFNNLNNDDQQQQQRQQVLPQNNRPQQRP